MALRGAALLAAFAVTCAPGSADVPSAPPAPEKPWSPEEWRAERDEQLDALACVRTSEDALLRIHAALHGIDFTHARALVLDRRSADQPLRWVDLDGVTRWPAHPSRTEQDRLVVTLAGILSRPDLETCESSMTSVVVTLDVACEGRFWTWRFTSNFCPAEMRPDADAQFARRMEAATGFHPTLKPLGHPVAQLIDEEVEDAVSRSTDGPRAGDVSGAAAR